MSRGQNGDFTDGAPLERLYPLSVVTDGMGINLTVVSYMGSLCFAITSCPSAQPEIGTLGNLIKKNYQELLAASSLP